MMKLRIRIRFLDLTRLIQLNMTCRRRLSLHLYCYRRGREVQPPEGHGRWGALGLSTASHGRGIYLQTFVSRYRSSLASRRVRIYKDAPADISTHVRPRRKSFRPPAHRRAIHHRSDFPRPRLWAVEFAGDAERQVLAAR